MSKSLGAIKKFSFFDIEKTGKAELNLSSVDYKLSNLIPVSFKVYNKYFYVSGQLNLDKSIKKDKNKLDIYNRFRLLKVHPDGNIMDEYIPFNDTIIDFNILNVDGRTYLVAVGTDLKSPGDMFEGEIEKKQGKQINLSSPKVIPSPNSIPSVKIIDFSENVEKTNADLFQWEKTKVKIKKSDAENWKKRVSELENMINIIKPLKQILLMNNKKDPKDFYQYKGKIEDYTPLTSISCFSVSQIINHVALVFGKNELLEIKTDSSPNLINSKDVKFVYKQIEEQITNLKHMQNNNYFYLFYSTRKNSSYKEVRDKDNRVYNVGDDGAEENNFDVAPNKILLSTPDKYYISEYEYYGDENFTKKGSKDFEKPTKFTQFYKTYHVFVLCEENSNTLCVYDPRNTIFIYYNSSFNNILSVLNDNDKLYVISEGAGQIKFSSFKEKENKEKFDNFYKKNFYDTAYNYARNLGYDKKKLSEISKLHAEYLYAKGDYDKSIEQYKLTINYLDPSYVIQKFLDGSKLNFLIEYLEALQNDEEFKSKCIPERLKDFTALLLNCYIKQKQIEKLKDFVESKNINDEVTIKTAIEVCKDTKKEDLALAIAHKANMVESYIQILMDSKGDYAESLDFIKNLKDIEKKFNIILKYGETFFEKKEVVEDFVKVINTLVNQIIDIRNKLPSSCNEEEKKIQQLQYEKIISIFITKESEAKLEVLLDNIMKNDQKCPKQVILRRIELYVDKYNENKDSGLEIVEKIGKIINDPKFRDQLDKNYLLMLFKISGFSQGVTELSKIMSLDQDLLQIYMETHDYEKINSTCETLMRKKEMERDNDKDNENEGKKNNKINYWLQALNYYMDISTKSTKNYLGNYIIQVLDKLTESKDENFSPMILLDIINKVRSTHGHIIEFKVIKKYILNWIKKQQEILIQDKKETEENYNKILANDQQLKELQIKAKTYNLSKCATCGQHLDPPFIYFICGHGYHQQCLNEDGDEDIECLTCKAKDNVLLNKIETGRKMAEQQDSFFKDIAEDRNADKKFDIFAEYLGKGIFINKNEELDYKKKEQEEDEEQNIEDE